MPSAPKNRCRGAALIDVVVAASLVVVVAGIAIPSVHAAREQALARSAARYFAGRLHHARLEAIKRNTWIALRFDPADLDQMRLYVDGDGDGVRVGDISQGVDQPLGDEFRLSDMFREISFRIVHEVPSPDGGGTLSPGSDPVRIGASNLLSFGPLGGATGGTIYLAASRGPQMAVRLLGATARIRVLRFDGASGQWLEV